MVRSGRGAQAQKPKEAERETARHASTPHLQEALYVPTEESVAAGQNLARKIKKLSELLLEGLEPVPHDDDGPRRYQAELILTHGNQTDELAILVDVVRRAIPRCP